MDDAVLAAKEYDIDSEAHEEHMHPHEGFEAARDEEHSVARFEAIASEQSARLTRKTASVFDLSAKRGAASPIDCAEVSAAHAVLKCHPLRIVAVNKGPVVSIGGSRPDNDQYTPIFDPNER